MDNASLWVFKSYREGSVHVDAMRYVPRKVETKPENRQEPKTKADSKTVAEKR